MAQMTVTMEAAFLVLIVLQGMGDDSVPVQSNDAEMQVGGHAARDARRQPDVTQDLAKVLDVEMMVYVMLVDVTKVKIKRLIMAKEPVLIGWSVELLSTEHGGNHKGFGEDHGQCGCGKDHTKRDLELLEGPRAKASGVLQYSGSVGGFQEKAFHYLGWLGAFQVALCSTFIPTFTVIFPTDQGHPSISHWWEPYVT